MKRIYFAAYMVACSIITGSCEKSTITAEPINCSLATMNHPKNDVYQQVVNKSFNAGLPGVSVVINTPEDGLWAGTAGYACIENNILMTPCHIHYAASIPKSFTAIAVLQLVQNGVISMEDKIGDYLDDDIKSYIPNCDKITIHHLLNHTSGIPDQVGIDFLTDFLNDPIYYYSQEELMSYLNGQESLWLPGTKHYYSDANYNILALILDRITGDHIRYFSENLFVPLGLENTYYSYAINHNSVANLVSAYMDTYSDGILQNITEWEDAITSYFKGSGGMATTPQDLTIFIQGVFNGSLLSAQTIESIKADTVHNPQADLWMNDSYGLGFMVIHDEHGTWYGHAGRDPGSASFIFYNPEHQITISAMTNIGTFFSLHYTEIFYGLLWDELCKVIFEEEEFI